jgi:hypothetical protein
MDNQIPQWMGRTQLLLGDEPILRLLKAHVLVAGLGGVGGAPAPRILSACSFDGSSGGLSSFNSILSVVGGTGGGSTCNRYTGFDPPVATNGVDAPVTNYNYQNNNLATNSYIPAGWVITNKPQARANRGSGNNGTSASASGQAGSGANGENGFCSLSY